MGNVRTLITSLMLAFVTVGCSSGGSNIPGVFVQRHSEPVLFSSIDQPVTQLPLGETTHAPLTVFAYVFTYTGTDNSSEIAKVEINMGDGLGWRDVTDETFDYWKKGARPDNAVVHTYAEAGRYVVESRTTWEDGAIVTSRDSAMQSMVLDLE